MSDPTGEAGAAEMPPPADATAVARSPEFAEVVAVALMRVVLDGAPGAEVDASASQNASRLVAANPSREAERFTVALATDPAIVAAALSPDGAGLEQLVEKLRAIWLVMCGDTGVIDHREQTPTRGKG